MENTLIILSILLIPTITTLFIIVLLLINQVKKKNKQSEIDSGIIARAIVRLEAQEELIKSLEGEISNPPQKLTPDELLEETKRRYPAGTRYLDVWYSNSQEVKEEPFFWDKECTQIAVNYGGGFVYDEGKWAKTITK